MVDTRDLLLDKIEAFLDRTGMGPTYFGRKAGVGGALVKRLRDGQDVGTRTMDKINAFIRSYPDHSTRDRSTRRERAAQSSP